MKTINDPSSGSTAEDPSRRARRRRARVPGVLAAIPLFWAACASPAGDGRSFGIDDDRELSEPGGTRAKVYVMIGESNMIGFGLVDHATHRIQEFYESPDEGARRGLVLSVYDGAYSPSVDYDQQSPIVTTNVLINDDYDWPQISGPHTSIVRGYFVPHETGEFVFEWGWGGASHASMSLDGQEVYRREIGEPVSVQERVQLVEGQRYAIEATYFQGHGAGAWTRRVGTPGTLETVVQDEGMFPHLRGEDGEWSARDDVWYRFAASTTGGALTVGQGKFEHFIGPELQFGHVMGDHHEQPVILLKAARDVSSLGWHLMPPGIERRTIDGWTYAGYGDPDERWPAGEVPGPSDASYAGMHYDEFVGQLHEVLDDCPQQFEEFGSVECEIAGFVFFHGHGDTSDDVRADRYEENLAGFIRAIRAEFDADDAPFVVAASGFQPSSGNTLEIVDAQLAVSGERGNYPEFADNVRTVETAKFWRQASQSPADEAGRYNQNAETLLWVGDAVGQAMIELVD